MVDAPKIDDTPANDSGKENPSESPIQGAKSDVGKLASDGTPNVKEVEKETIKIKISYCKQALDVLAELDDTVHVLKNRVEIVSGIPASMQKLVYKGLARDDQTLRELKVVNGSKFMLIGSTAEAIEEMNRAASIAQSAPEESSASSKKEPLSSQKPHCVVLEKHKMPEDVMPGILNCKEALPPIPLHGMYNKYGARVRLTFKLETDHLWIGTKERTDKIPMDSIRSVISEPIVGHEQYHILGFQLGPTEASRYWVYWVPAQYVDAIKNTVLGAFPF